MVLSRCPLLRNIRRYSIMENQGTEIETDSSILQTYIAIKNQYHPRPIIRIYKAVSNKKSAQNIRLDLCKTFLNDMH
jgi:hypothetical protein